MGEIWIDGQLVSGMWIDGKEMDEVWIDGCVIAFEKLLRTGWISITGGSGSFNVNLTEAKTVIQAGIRFRGMSQVNSTHWTGYGSTSAVTGVGNTLTCVDAPIPSLPSAPFGCQITGYTGNYGGRVSGCKENPSYYTGTGSIYVGGALKDSMSTVFPDCPSTMKLAEGIGSGLPVTGCVASNSADPNDTVRGAVQARAQYGRACDSAMDERDVSFHGPWAGTYSFWLSSGSLAPSSSGHGNTQINHKDGNNDWFFVVPFPDSAFVVGESNTITLNNIDGSGRVQVEVFVVYR